MKRPATQLKFVAGSYLYVPVPDIGIIGHSKLLKVIDILKPKVKTAAKERRAGRVQVKPDQQTVIGPFKMAGGIAGNVGGFHVGANQKCPVNPTLERKDAGI